MRYSLWRKSASCPSGALGCIGRGKSLVNSKEKYEQKKSKCILGHQDADAGHPAPSSAHPPTASTQQLWGRPEKNHEAIVSKTKNEQREIN